jgi:hypothetical protein
MLGRQEQIDGFDFDFDTASRQPSERQDLVVPNELVEERT